MSLQNNINEILNMINNIRILYTEMILTILGL